MNTLKKHLDELKLKEIQNGLGFKTIINKKDERIELFKLATAGKDDIHFSCIILEMLQTLWSTRKGDFYEVVKITQQAFEKDLRNNQITLKKQKKIIETFKLDPKAFDLDYWT